jgi:hypothetical protein
MRRVGWDAHPQKDWKEEAVCIDHERRRMGLWVTKASFSKPRNPQVFPKILGR